jgi:hypothetical protein
MIELLIALFLVTACVLPLARFPFLAAQEEFNSAYRLQVQRLADLACADIQEQLCKEEILWKDIIRSEKDKATVLDNKVTISFDPLGKRTFSVLGTLHSVGKKGPNGEEWRLATVSVNIEPLKKEVKLFRTKKRIMTARIFTYQLLIHKAVAPALIVPITTS